MSLTVADILRTLPALSERERVSIVAACAMLSTNVEAADQPQELLWRGYRMHADEMGIALPVLGFAMKSSTWPAFRKKAVEFDEWLTRMVGDMTLDERTHSYRVVARCVMAMCEEMQLVLTPTTLMQQAGNATQALNLAFPGYAASGLLRRALL